MFVDALDGRSALARRYRDLVAAFSADLGDDLTEAQRQLVRRAASISVWSEEQERRVISGDDLDAGPLITAANTLRRLLSDLGIKRAVVTPAAPKPKTQGCVIGGYLNR
ncbi:hypothetical protein ACVINZ_001603 [Mesorhizobium jarvisii]